MDGPSRYDARPSHELLPGTLRVISVRMNYLPANAAFARTLKDPRWVTSAVMPSGVIIISCYVIA